MGRCLTEKKPAKDPILGQLAVRELAHQQLKLILQIVIGAGLIAWALLLVLALL